MSKRRRVFALVVLALLGAVAAVILFVAVCLAVQEK
jgi:hypothetical protein